MELKQKQLKSFKRLATLLLLAMFFIFVISSHFIKIQHGNVYLEVLKAFSEAAMVGALADWFAVTALFKYPLGLKIPHTNIIASKKDKLGEQLGVFVLENFFEAQTIKPYIKKIVISKMLFEYLSVPSNFSKIIIPIEQFLIHQIQKWDTTPMEEWIIALAKHQLSNVKFNEILSDQLLQFLNNTNYLEVENNLIATLHQLVIENESALKNKILENSYTFTPKFIDEKIANKVYVGILAFAEEIQQDTQHVFRKKCRDEIANWAHNLQEKPESAAKINALVQNFINTNLDTVLTEVLQSAKTSFLSAITPANSPLLLRMREAIYQKIMDAFNEPAYFDKLDTKIQSLVFLIFQKNKSKIAFLIEDTIKKWNAKQLSEKLELEVGKDLQYIRINGTLVGGFIGVVLFFLEKLLLF